MRRLDSALVLPSARAMIKGLSVTGALLWGVVAFAAEDPSLTFFKDLAETRNYALGRPVAPQLTGDGSAVLFLRSGPRNPVLRLYEYTVATGRERELVSPEQILGEAQEVLSPEERAHRERTRNSLKGFTEFDLSKDGTRVLVMLSGRLFVVARSNAQVLALPGQDWIAPRFSPDGAFVAAVHGGDLHVIDLATRTERALTSGSTAVLTRGVAEFIAQEEMTRREGFWWSPDSRWIAYQETDESGVEDRYIADPLHPESPPRKYAYPRAGTANAKVRLGVMSREGGPTRWMSWDAGQFPYLTRVEWREPGAPLTFLVEDRRQHEERLLAADIESGSTRQLLAETDPAWLELVEPGLPRWLKGAHAFLWASERSGFWQLEARDATGTVIRSLTPGEVGYRSLVGVDDSGGSVYVVGSADPTEAHLWRFPLAGGAGRRLTSARGVHAALLSENGRVLVHDYALLDGKSGTEVLSAEGASLGVLRSVADSPHVIPNVELTRTPGRTSFYAAILRPHDERTGKRHPVILAVYGGPQITYVTSAARNYFIDQWMADQGYIVVRIDGRGTPLRGRDWQRVMRGNFIETALHDQVEGLQALGTRYPEMDLGRVGVTGWSFGGYFSAMAVLRRPDVFAAGVAGAPVVTWENYDTYYTERYLGLPQDNPEGYKASSVLTYAPQLTRPLLIMHGLTDDNVYFQHAVQLAEALFVNGRPFDFLPLLGTHMSGASSAVVRLRQEQRIMEFLGSALRSQPRGR